VVSIVKDGAEEEEGGRPRGGGEGVVKGMGQGIRGLGRGWGREKEGVEEGVGEERRGI